MWGSRAHSERCGYEGWEGASEQKGWGGAFLCMSSLTPRRTTNPSRRT